MSSVSLRELLSSDALKEYNRARVYLDEDYKSKEHFTVSPLVSWGRLWGFSCKLRTCVVNLLHLSQTLQKHIPLWCLCWCCAHFWLLEFCHLRFLNPKVMMQKEVSDRKPLLSDTVMVWHSTLWCRKLEHKHMLTCHTSKKKGDQWLTVGAAAFKEKRSFYFTSNSDVRNSIFSFNVIY